MAHTVRGLHLRRSTYWFQPPQVGGVRPKAFSLQTCNEGEAVALALERLQDPEIHAPASWVHEVEAYLAEARASKRLSASFSQTRKMSLLGFARRYDVTRPERVTSAMVERYYADLRADGLTEGTAQGYVFSLRAFFRALLKAHKVRVNPAEKIQMDRVARYYQHRVCTKLEVDCLVNYCTRPDLKFALLCGFDAGLRKNEISEAVPAWFATPGIIHLSNSAEYELKDGEARYIPLTDRFAAFLADYPAREPYMLHPEIGRGRAYTRYDIRRPFAEHCKALSQRPLDEYGQALHDFSWITIQTMRHTFASLRIQKGVSAYKVARWLGDGIAVVERHYGHLAPQADKDVEI